MTVIQLAFRQTVYHYGTDLCWTPMVLAKEFNRNSFARDSGKPHPRSYRNFYTNAIHRPHHLNKPLPTANHCPIRRQLTPRTRSRLIPRRPRRQRRRPQLRLPPVVGLRRDTRRRAHGPSRAGAGHGRRDEAAAAAGRVACGHGEGYQQSQGEECECED